MDDGGVRAFQTVKAGADQIFAALGEHLDKDILRHTARSHEPLNKVELGCASAGETNLDFFDPNFDKLIEKAVLLHRIHRVDNRLIAVAQIGREPAGRRGDRLARPLTIRQIDLRERGVFARWVTQHIGG